MDAIDWPSIGKGAAALMLLFGGIACADTAMRKAKDRGLREAFLPWALVALPLIGAAFALACWAFARVTGSLKPHPGNHDGSPGSAHLQGRNSLANTKTTLMKAAAAQSIMNEVADTTASPRNRSSRNPSKAPCMTQLPEKTAAGNTMANIDMARLNRSPRQGLRWAPRTNVPDRNSASIRWWSANCHTGELATSNLQTNARRVARVMTTATMGRATRNTDHSSSREIQASIRFTSSPWEWEGAGPLPPGPLYEEISRVGFAFRTNSNGGYLCPEPAVDPCD